MSERVNSKRFIDHFYVVSFAINEDGTVGAVQDYSTFHSLEMAIEHYLQLNVAKALGIKNTREPYAGSLDFVQNFNGDNKFITDWQNKGLEFWQNDEVKQAVKHLKERLTWQ